MSATTREQLWLPTTPSTNNSSWFCDRAVEGHRWIGSGKQAGAQAQDRQAGRQAGAHAQDQQDTQQQSQARNIRNHA